MAALYGFTAFQRAAIPGTIFNELQTDFKASATDIALLASLYLCIYGGMQIFSGVAADRFGSKKVVLVGGALLSAGCILFPLSHSLFTLFAFRCLIAFGGSLLFLSVIKELDLRFSDKHFPALVGAALFTGFAGGLFGTQPFERLVSHYGWRNPLMGVGIACFLVYICAAILTRNNTESKQQLGASSPILPALKAIITNPKSLPVIFSHTTMWSIYLLMQAVIGKKILQDCAGISSEAASRYTFLMMLSLMIFTILAGFMPRLFVHRRKPVVLIINLSAIAAVLLCFPILHGATNGVFLAYILFGLAASGSAVFLSLIKELNQPDFAGSSTGIDNGAVNLGAAILAQAAGKVLDKFTPVASPTSSVIQYPSSAYQLILIGCLILAIISFITSCFIHETKGQNLWEESAVLGP
jgi:predicted MFS family arabinose efflux permease